jgi:hypothetical protein
MKALLFILSFVLLALTALAVPPVSIQDTSAGVCPNGHIRRDITLTDNIIVDTAFAMANGFSSHINKDLRIVLSIIYKLDGVVSAGNNTFQLWKGKYFLRFYKEGSLVHVSGGDVQLDRVVIQFQRVGADVFIRIFHGARRIQVRFVNSSAILLAANPLANSFWDALEDGLAHFRLTVNNMQHLGASKSEVTMTVTNCNPKALTVLCPEDECDCMCDEDTNECTGLDASFDRNEDNMFPRITLVPAWCACRGGTLPPPPEPVEDTGKDDHDRRADKPQEPAPPPIIITPPGQAITCPFFTIELIRICEFINATFCKKVVSEFDALALDTTTAAGVRTWTLTGRVDLDDSKDIGADSVYLRVSISHRMSDDTILISLQLNQLGNFWQWIPFQSNRLVFTFRVDGEADLVLTSSSGSGTFVFSVSGSAALANEKQLLEGHDADAELTINFPQLDLEKGTSPPVAIVASSQADERVHIDVAFTRDHFAKDNTLMYGPITANIRWMQSEGPSGTSVAPTSVQPTSETQEETSETDMAPTSETQDDDANPNNRQEGDNSMAVNLQSWVVW